MNMFILQLIFISLMIVGITWVLAGYNGLSWTFVIVLIVVGIYQFITTQTVLGRHIYAIGGNPEAAQLSGISVQRMTFIVFGLDGYAIRAVRHLVLVPFAVRNHHRREPV